MPGLKLEPKTGLRRLEMRLDSGMHELRSSLSQPCLSLWTGEAQVGLVPWTRAQQGAEQVGEQARRGAGAGEGAGWRTAGD